MNREYGCAYTMCLLGTIFMFRCTRDVIDDLTCQVLFAIITFNMTAISQNTHAPLIARPTKSTLLESALSLIWSLRHPLSPLSEPLIPITDRLTYQSKDGWRVTMEHFPHTRGRGEPVLIYMGPLIHSRILRLGEGQFLRSLQENGFDVFLFSHRGQRNSIRLPSIKSTSANHSWNDILHHDLPCAVDAIKRYTKATRIFMLGHGLGGLMTYSWLSGGGARDLAGNITIDAPALYTPRKIPVRYQLIQQILAHWTQYPTKALAQLQAQRSLILHPEISPQRSRGILHHCLENISPSMAQQLTQWLRTGRFCSKTQHHLSTIRSCTLPKLFLAGSHEDVSSYVSFTNDCLSQGTFHKSSWNHLPFWEDSALLTAPLLEWISPLRDRCWEE